MDESSNHATLATPATPATLATLVQVSPENSLQTALILVQELKETIEKGETISEEQSGWFAGQQERVFESADHESESGTCECDHHLIAYQLGDISDQYYQKDFELNLKYLNKLERMIEKLL
jgi:hypothetical protein